MAHSEIDAIFASKPSAPAAPQPGLQTKRRKSKKRRRSDNDDSTPQPTAPQVFTDSSSRVSPAPAIKKRKSHRPKPTSKIKVASRQSVADEARFKDSRGAVSRKQTEEGYAIYKEDELSIRPEAGGTPLCPFDCDCCF